MVEKLYAKLKEKIYEQERLFWDIYKKLKDSSEEPTEREFFNGKWDSLYHLTTFIEALEKQNKK